MGDRPVLSESATFSAWPGDRRFGHSSMIPRHPLLKRARSRSDAVSIGSACKAEFRGEFTGIKEVGRIVLVEHFIRFRDCRLEPTRYPDDGPAKNTILWRNTKFLRGQSDQFLSCGRIGCGRNMPGLIPGGLPLRELHQTLCGVRREGPGMRDGIIDEPRACFLSREWLEDENVYHAV